MIGSPFCLQIWWDVASARFECYFTPLWKLKKMEGCFSGALTGEQSSIILLMESFYALVN